MKDSTPAALRSGSLTSQRNLGVVVPWAVMMLVALGRRLPATGYVVSTTQCMPVPVSPSHTLASRLAGILATAGLTAAKGRSGADTTCERDAPAVTKASPSVANSPSRYTTTHSDAPRANTRPCARVPTPNRAKRLAALVTDPMMKCIAAESVSGVPTLANTVAAKKTVIGCDRMKPARAKSSVVTVEPALTTTARSLVNPCSPHAIALTSV
eukprot:226427-Pleurochrysis_carterae.AAC.1